MMRIPFMKYLAAFVAVLAVTPSLADSPFNGKDLSNWEAKKESKGKNSWVVGTPTLDPSNPKVLKVEPGASALINAVSAHGQGWDLYTSEKWGGTFRIELELMVPNGSNSGVYVMGEYEVQVLDSHGKPDKDMSAGDIGAIYSAAVPKLNAARKPGEWQKFVIDFAAPQFDAAGKKTANANFIQVTLNDQVLHSNVEMKGPTPGGLTGQEHSTGPLMFQGNHGAAAFRNISIKPL